jgi:hypothetical protein
MTAKQEIRAENIAVLNERRNDKWKEGRLRRLGLALKVSRLGRGGVSLPRANRCFAFCCRVFECNKSFLNHNC